jgi:fibronectin type III domain protein
MKIERRWSYLTQMLGALVISVVLLSGCGGSSQSAGTASDASSAAAVTPPVSTSTATGSTVVSTPVASTPVASTPVSSTPGSSATGDNVTLSWSAPTENTNGSALTNLAGYIIYYGTSASAMTQTIDINTVGIQTYVVDNLSAGNWYFQIVAVNSAGEHSSPSATVNASI